MSRLDSMLRRLTAQRDGLNWAASLRIAAKAAKQSTMPKPRKLKTWSMGTSRMATAYFENASVQMNAPIPTTHTSAC